MANNEFHITREFFLPTFLQTHSLFKTLYKPGLLFVICKVLYFRLLLDHMLPKNKQGLNNLNHFFKKLYISENCTIRDLNWVLFKNKNSPLPGKLWYMKAIPEGFFSENLIFYTPIFSTLLKMPEQEEPVEFKKKI